MTGLDIERMVEERLEQYREVPGLLEWQLPVGTTWLRLLAEGRPTTTEAIASVLGWPVDELASLLRAQGYQPDAQPFAATETDDAALPVYRIHWLDTGETGRVPGCAPDALIAVQLARRPARVELPCPATGKLISVHLGADGSCHGVHPAEAVATTPSADSGWHPRNWTRSDCANGLLFASATAASTWLADHPGHETVPIAQFVHLESRFLHRALTETDPG